MSMDVLSQASVILRVLTETEKANHPQDVVFMGLYLSQAVVCLLC